MEIMDDIQLTTLEAKEMVEKYPDEAIRKRQTTILLNKKREEAAAQAFAGLDFFIPASTGKTFGQPLCKLNYLPSDKLSLSGKKTKVNIFRMNKTLCHDLGFRFKEGERVGVAFAWNDKTKLILAINPPNNIPQIHTTYGGGGIILNNQGIASHIIERHFGEDKMKGYLHEHEYQAEFSWKNLGQNIIELTLREPNFSNNGQGTETA